jgi:hypothetical protein
VRCSKEREQWARKTQEDVRKERERKGVEQQDVYEGSRRKEGEQQDV